MSDSLARLRQELTAEGGLLAQALVEDPTERPVPPGPEAGRPGPPQIAAVGPRAAPRSAEYELVLEAIYEGYLLHYGRPRLLHPVDSDLALLAGDRLYALGLERLVALGDLDAVHELADVISLSSLAHAQDDVELAQAVWEAGARAVGWGPSSAHAAAKELARRGSPGAAAALRGARA